MKIAIATEAINGEKYTVEVDTDTGKFWAIANQERVEADSLQKLRDKLGKVAKQKLGDGIPVTIVHEDKWRRGDDKDPLADLPTEDGFCVGLHRTQHHGLFRNSKGEPVNNHYDTLILQRLTAEELAHLQRLRRAHEFAEAEYSAFRQRKAFDARKAVALALSGSPAGQEKK